MEPVHYMKQRFLWGMSKTTLFEIYSYFILVTREWMPSDVCAFVYNHHGKCTIEINSTMDYSNGVHFRNKLSSSYQLSVLLMILRALFTRMFQGFGKRIPTYKRIYTSSLLSPQYQLKSRSE